MNWPDKVRIYGHSANHILEKIDDGVYHCTDANYYRVILNTDGSTKAIDYDGGPMLIVGDSIKDLGILDSIVSGVLYFKNDTEIKNN